MSYLSVSEVKDYLDVIHSSDDTKLQYLLDGAEKSALEFMNRTSFAEICEEDSNYDSDAALMPDPVRIAIYLMVQAFYHATPDDMPKLEKAAERLLMPFRCNMGI